MGSGEGAEQLAELRRNVVLQLSMFNKIQKPSAYLLQFKGYKNDAHKNDTMTIELRKKLIAPAMQVYNYNKLFTIKYS